MEALLDKNFFVYKTQNFPRFTSLHLHDIKAHCANYVFKKYISTTADIIPIYKSVDDVDIDVSVETIDESDLLIHNLTIKHGNSSQVACFVQDQNSILALLKSGSPEFLVSLLESLDFDTPLSLRECSVDSDRIRNLVDAMAPVIAKNPRTMGSIDLTFAPKEKLKKDSLREILVNIPTKDSHRLLERSDKPMETMLQWLTKATRVKFGNMDNKSFISELICVSRNGRIRLVGDNIRDDSTATTLLLRQVCRALA